ncbi:hypothetical protein ACHAXT_013226 [Thalassiosira profunda]
MKGAGVAGAGSGATAASCVWSIMIHDKQVRQLCAVHSVNNLLQLPHDSGVDDEDGEGGGEMTANVHQWTCRGRILQQTGGRIVDGPSTTTTPGGKTDAGSKKHRRKWGVATQQEFDEIAEEFTLREQMLFASDESPNEKSGRISLLQRVRSQYGTPYFGNYSLEVIEEALKRRGVEMEFYRVPDNARTPFENNGGDNSDTASTAKCLIGFIIYEKEESERNALSFLSRIGSQIPVIKHWCGVGLHWYAITGVRHNLVEGGQADASSRVDNDSSWKLIDSKRPEISTLTDKELMDYVRAVQQEGGLVFRATMDGEISDR